MFDIFFSVMGLIGAAFVVGMYWMLQAEKVDSQSVFFFTMNGIGATLVMVSIAVRFDMADLGGIAVEICWALVSLAGLVKALRRRTQGV